MNITCLPLITKRVYVLTSMPDHADPGFDEAKYFNQFKKHNIIVHAVNKDSHCDDHAGCLSIKTVLRGEE